jgi:hypothetical protein
MVFLKGLLDIAVSDRLPVVDQHDLSECQSAKILTDEPYRAIAEQNVGPAGMKSIDLHLVVAVHGAID